MVFKHGEKGGKKGLLEFKWHQKTLNFLWHEKEEKGLLGGAVPFVESHMETELQFVAEKLKIVEGGEKKRKKNMCEQTKKI